MRLKLPLKMHRLLSLLAFVCALIGGVLVLVFDLGGAGRLSIGSLAINGLLLLFGLGAIRGGLADLHRSQEDGQHHDPLRRNSSFRPS